MDMTYAEESNIPLVSSRNALALTVCTIWLTTIFILGANNVFNSPVNSLPLGIGLAIGTPVVSFLLIYRLSTQFRTWALSLDMRQLIMLHSWRMIGLGFIFLHFEGELTAPFAYSAGIGDAMAAIGATFLVLSLFQQPEKVNPRSIYRWNLFGLTDFAIAVGLGIFSRTGQFLQVGEHNTDILGSFPIVLIPAFAVPFYVIIHLIIFAQLRQQSAE